MEDESWIHSGPRDQAQIGQWSGCNSSLQSVVATLGGPKFFPLEITSTHKWKSAGSIRWQSVPTGRGSDASSISTTNDSSNFDHVVPLNFPFLFIQIHLRILSLLKKYFILYYYYFKSIWKYFRADAVHTEVLQFPMYVYISDWMIPYWIQ